MEEVIQAEVVHVHVHVLVLDVLVLVLEAGDKERGNNNDGKKQFPKGHMDKS